MSRSAVVALVIASTLAIAGTSSWPDTLPRLRLSDPLGAEFTDEQLTARGAVFVVTAPTLSQGDAQQAWSAAFKDAPAGAVVVFLEDMTQSYFRPLVISRMKEAYRQGASHKLLLDETGATRKALGVGENATVVFAFTAGGKLAAVETGACSRERAEKLLRAARGQ